MNTFCFSSNSRDNCISQNYTRSCHRFEIFVSGGGNGSGNGDGYSVCCLSGGEGSRRVC